MNTFLLDHVVAGAPLLLTMMQLDLVARALPACCPDQKAPAGIMLQDAGLPALRWAAAGTVLRPRLLELLLQCCGLWELADSGRMMVPAAIERVHWHPDSLTADPREPAVACVVPRSGAGSGSRGFDGQVMGRGGSVLVTVTGYRTTDLGIVPDLAHAIRLRRRLDAPHLDALPAATPAVTLTAAAVAERGAL